MIGGHGDDVCDWGQIDALRDELMPLKRDMGKQTSL